MILSLSCPAQGKALKIQYAETLGSLVTSPDLISPTFCLDPASSSRQRFFPLPSLRQDSGLTGKIAAAQALHLIQSLALQDELKKKCHPKDGAAFSIIHGLQLPRKVYLGTNVSSVAPS